MVNRPSAWTFADARTSRYFDGIASTFPRFAFASTRARIRIDVGYGLRPWRHPLGDPEKINAWWARAIDTNLVTATGRPRMTENARYRVEDGRSCIDIKVKHSAQLFDGRDPAPFRERDLDEDAVEYLLAAAQEIPRKQRLKIVMTISEEPEPHLERDVIVDAVRSHFLYERGQLERRLREHVRRGQMILAVGLTVLVVFLTLAEFAASLPSGHVREILREGLVITGWVAMWRPLEVLLYDWWPLIDERRDIGRILEAPVSIQYDGDVPGQAGQL